MSKRISKYGKKFFDQKTGLRESVNKQLAKDLHKPVIKKIKKKSVYARFKDKIWAADLAEIRSLSLKNKKLDVYCLS